MINSESNIILKLKFSIIISLCVVLTACNFHEGNRSGDQNDDYVEEPLSDRSKKYENALKVSNKVIDLISEDRYVDLYENYFDEEFPATGTLEEFKKMILEVKKIGGDVKKYKTMQWGFWSKNEYDKDLLYSIKIVEHEKVMLKYYLVFRDDGIYEKLHGIFFRERKGVARPGEM